MTMQPDPDVERAMVPTLAASVADAGYRLVGRA